MTTEIQNFDDPVIDWTKANLLESTRFQLIILNDPTAKVGETATGTVIAYQSRSETDPDYKVGEFRVDFDPLTFKLFYGQALLKNS